MHYIHYIHYIQTYIHTYITYIPFQSLPVHSIPSHYIPLHSITFHYIAVQYIQTYIHYIHTYITYITCNTIPYHSIMLQNITKGDHPTVNAGATQVNCFLSRLQFMDNTKTSMVLCSACHWLCWCPSYFAQSHDKIMQWFPILLEPHDVPLLQHLGLDTKKTMKFKLRRNWSYEMRSPSCEFHPNIWTPLIVARVDGIVSPSSDEDDPATFFLSFFLCFLSLSLSFLSFLCFLFLRATSEPQPT